MELLATGSCAYGQASRSFRHNVLGDLVMALLFGACLLGMGYGLMRISAGLPPLLWIVVGPVAFVTGLLLALVASTGLRAFLAGHKPSNWHARVGPNGLHLNLRSYRNAHFGGDTPTVVFFPFGEIERIARVTEARVEKRGSKTTQIRSRWIELELAGVDTQALAAAVAAERNREAPAEKGWIASARTKHHHVPVLCPGPERVLVEWHNGLFRALSGRVAAASPREIDLDTEFAGLLLEERAAALAMRGQRISAIRVLCAEGDYDRDSARAWLSQNAS